MLTITKRLIYFNVFSLLLFVLALGAMLRFQVSYLPLFLQIALPILGLALIIGNAVGLYYRNELKWEINDLNSYKYIDDPNWRFNFISRRLFILGNKALLEACKGVKSPLLVDADDTWAMDKVVHYIQKTGLRFLMLRNFGYKGRIDQSWELLRDRLRLLDIAINHLCVTVSAINIGNGTIERFVKLFDDKGPKKVSYIWGISNNNIRDFSYIETALTYLEKTNITSLGLWGESESRSINFFTEMLTKLPHIPKNIKELDLSVKVDYALEELKLEITDDMKAMHVQKLVLNGAVLHTINIRELKKFLELFPNVTEVKLVDACGQTTTAYNSNFISNLMEGRKALQKAQADGLLNCFNGSSDVAKIAAGYLVLPGSAFASKSPAGGQPGVPSQGAQAGIEDEEKQGPGPGK